ncbi:Transcriptional regulator, TetR family [Pseudoalteromonas luteoviolacea B = ATCC 29581]|nr:Transcriptional regulator, TetR family [Pseudoalteromonas luteoviolacea B = ATCC 29581]
MKLSEMKRAQIVSAAETLFCTRGFDATSMDQVSQQANVSKRTVYNHFSAKNELFQAVLDNMFSRIAEGQAVAFDISVSIDEQLKQIAQKEVDLLLSEEFIKIARVAFLQLLQDPSLAVSLSGKAVGCMRYFEAFLNAACQAHKLKIDDISLAAKQFVYQLKSLIFYPTLYGLEEISTSQQNYVIEETVKLFLSRYQSTPHDG